MLSPMSALALFWFYQIDESFCDDTRYVSTLNLARHILDHQSAGWSRDLTEWYVSLPWSVFNLDPFVA